MLLISLAFVSQICYLFSKAKVIFAFFIYPYALIQGLFLEFSLSTKR